MLPVGPAPAPAPVAVAVAVVPPRAPPAVVPRATVPTVDGLLLAASLGLAVLVAAGWRRGSIPRRQARLLGGAALVWTGYATGRATAGRRLLGASVDLPGVLVGGTCVLAGFALALLGWRTDREDD